MIQAIQASSFKADPDFRQDDAFVKACPEFNSGMTATGMIPARRIRQNDGHD